MNCPECGQNFKLRDWFKFWLTVNLPDPIYRWRERRYESSQLEKLKALYTSSGPINWR